MNVKVNLPNDMDELEDRICKIMAQLLVDEYGYDKIGQALSILKEKQYNKNKII